MDPLISSATLKRIKAEIAEMHEYIKTLEVDSLPWRVAVAHLQALGRQHNNISSNLPVAQPPAPPRILTPIRSSMGAIANAGKREKVETWDWNNLNAKQAAVMEKVQNEVKALFFKNAEKHILKLITLSGGLKKALEKTSLSALAVLPDFVRRQQGAVLLKTFEEKLLK